MVLFLQWNARSLLANGQEFKKYVDELPIKPDVICVQETWLKSNLEFRIVGYSSVRSDREEGVGGGCATFIQDDMAFREVNKGSEYVVVEIWTGEGKVVIVNFYNPCKRLSLNSLVEIDGMENDRVVICGDFNAHSTLWGGTKTDANGGIIEELLEEKQMVCLNDGRGTRIDVYTGNTSVLDLTLVSRNLGGRCEWDVDEDTTIGSDHFPVFCQLQLGKSKRNGGMLGRWIFSSARWELFTYICETEMSTIDLNEDIEVVEGKIREIFIEAANQAISKSKGKMKRKAVPWWSDECAKAVKDRNKAFRILRRTHSLQNLIVYKYAQAKVKKIIRNAKRVSWQWFCNKIGRVTPVGEVWEMIKKMRGIRKEYQYPVLKKGEEAAISDGEKAEMIAKELVKIYSSYNLTEDARRGRIRTREAYPGVLVERQVGNSVLDVPFTISEMRRAIARSGITAPGDDGICYIMLKHLGPLAMMNLLGLYNKVWDKGKLPTAWKEAVIIPIRKPGKDPSKPENYRPIALTSHLGKIMERMVTERLTFYFESRELLSPYQSGFRRGRGTMDPIICLETEIKKAQVNKESVMAVFFDVEKAYDMVWKEGLMIKLHNIGISGRVFNWVKSFLFERSIRVKIGAVVSRKYLVDNGTPQGSVISPLLFSIMINDVFSQVPSDINRSLFADDGALWKRGRNVDHIRKRIQESVNMVEKWSYLWGFKFSVEKTKSIIFTRKKKDSNGMEVKLYGQIIEQVKVFKFLGLWFDSKLNWNEHINKILSKCKKVVNVMRCLSGSEWGASREALKNVYTALIRSVLDYGSLVYGSAAKTSLKKLEIMNSQALRLCCGAIKSTSVDALHVEMGEMPLCLRRVQLMMNYWVNLKGQSEGKNPASKVLIPCWESERAKSKCFAWISGTIAREMRLNQEVYIPTVPITVTPPWIFPQVFVDLYLLENYHLFKDIGNLAAVVEDRIHTVYQNYVAIYTDGSKDPTGRTSYAFTIPSLQISNNRRTTDHLAVYTVELVAIVSALNWIELANISKVIVCSDSSSALMSIQSFSSQSRQDIINEIYETLFRIHNWNIEIIFLWVPAHRGVKGNEIADSLAKEAIKQENVMEILLSRTEIKAMIKSKITNKWQDKWKQGTTGRHLYNIQNEVGKMRRTGRSTKEENVISRLRLGHTRLNSTLHLMGKHPTALCECGQGIETVEHVLIHCQKYATEREIFRRTSQQIEIKQILSQTGNYNSLIVFLKETGLINRL